MDTSRKTTVARLLNGLGIQGVGEANAKVIARYFKNDLDKIINARYDELVEIDGIGKIMAGDIVRYFENKENCDTIEKMRQELEFQIEKNTAEQIFEGMTFVVTGSLNHYDNRDNLKAEIESLGGKVAGSVSSKTSYLINNDVNSQSSKNKKARSLNVPDISEEDYIKLLS